jgi:hypothetical protein
MTLASYDSPGDPPNTHRSCPGTLAAAELPGGKFNPNTSTPPVVPSDVVVDGTPTASKPTSDACVYPRAPRPRARHHAAHAATARASKRRRARVRVVVLAFARLGRRASSTRSRVARARSRVARDRSSRGIESNRIARASSSSRRASSPRAVSRVRRASPHRARASRSPRSPVARASVCGRGAATSRANRSIDRSIELDRDRRVVDRGFDSIDDASIAMGSIRAIDAPARCLAIARERDRDRQTTTRRTRRRERRATRARGIARAIAAIDAARDAARDARGHRESIIIHVFASCG